jgi:hypothetical protein
MLAKRALELGTDCLKHEVLNRRPLQGSDRLELCCLALRHSDDDILAGTERIRAPLARTGTTAAMHVLSHPFRALHFHHSLLPEREPIQCVHLLDCLRVDRPILRDGKPLRCGSLDRYALSHHHL